MVYPPRLASIKMHPQLLSKLSKPSRVASILDWKRHSQSSNTNTNANTNTSTQQQQQQQAHTVLALNIHKNRVGIAVASHPSLGMPCLELEPLRFRKRSIAGGAIDANCLERFAAIIEDYKVCGIVVNWPLQHDTGRMGAACGRVVFALEQLVERSNESWRKQQQQQQATNGNGNAIESNNDHSNHHNNSGFLSRPFCLWDAGHIETLQREDPSRMVDSFGRCASYGREPTTPPNNNNNNNHYRASASAASNNHHEHDQHQQQQQQYFAAKEQYYEDELTVVLGVWDDFCREHWPDLYQSQQLQLQLQSQTRTQSQTELQSQLQEEPIAATTTTASNSNSNNNEAGMIHRRCGQHSGSTPVDAQQQQLSPPLPASSSTSATSTATPTPPVSKLRQSMVKQKKSLILMR